MTQVTHHHTLIDSDAHFWGLSCSANDFYLEYLEHETCDTRIWNGDMLDTARIMMRKNIKAEEIVKRIFDRMFAHVAEGKRWVWIFGNHDADGRKMDHLFKKKFMGIEFKREMWLRTPKNAQGKRALCHVSHGDQYDSFEQSFVKTKSKWGVMRMAKKAILWLGDRAYCSGVRLSARIDRMCNILFNRHPRILSRFNHIFDHAACIVSRHEKNAAKALKGFGKRVMAIINGHTHIPALKNGYMNSGDWVENYTSLSLSHGGTFSLLRWTDRRKELGLKRHFNILNQENKYAAFRPQTEKLLAEIARCWPGNGQKKKGDFLLNH